RIHQRVAVLEAQHRRLRQQAVVDLEATLVARQVGERRVLGAALLVDQHRVPLAEGAAGGVLAREAHVVALEQQRAERERLGEGPVDAAALPDRLAAALEERPQLLVHLEAGRQRRDALRDLLQPLDRHARVGLLLRYDAREARPGPARLV